MTQISKNKILLIAGACLVIGYSVFIVGVLMAKANPSYFNRSQFAAATSTVAYQTPGTATTTLAYDLGVNTNQAADSATLLVQYAGSSSPNSVLNIDIQYAQGNGQDCTLNPSPCDWYATSPGWNQNLVGTTSVPTLIGTVQQYSFTFASSTINRILPTNANGATSTRAILVTTPTKYVRAIFSEGGTANGAVWAEWVSKRQASQ